MTVSYSKEQRKICTEQNTRLYTIGVTQKGGTGLVQIQGPCGDKVAKAICDAIGAVSKIQTENKNDMYP